MTSEQILLDSFADNGANLITAADLRSFVTAVYSELLVGEDTVDALDSTSITAALSANQGKELDEAKVDGTGIDGTFTTTDGKTITIVNGVVTAIV